MSRPLQTANPNRLSVEVNGRPDIWDVTMNQDYPPRAVTSWHRAPKDGSVINVEFEDGEIAQVRWDVSANLWQLPRPGGMVPLHQTLRGTPRDWWPVF